MRRALALLLAAGVIPAGCAGGPDDAAAPAAPRPAPASAGSAPFGAVGDTRDGAVEASVAPGGTGVLRVRVANAGARPRGFRVAARVPAPLRAGTVEVVVAARSSRSVALPVTAPPAATPGSRRAVVRVAPAAGGRAGLRVAYAVEVPARVRVAAR